MNVYRSVQNVTQEKHNVYYYKNKIVARIFDSELETVMLCIEDVDDCIRVVERCIAIGYLSALMFN